MDSALDTGRGFSSGAGIITGAGYGAGFAGGSGVGLPLHLRRQIRIWEWQKRRGRLHVRINMCIKIIYLKGRRWLTRRKKGM